MITERRQKILLIGAGVGGLSAAARLANQGFEVEVFEKQHEPGGRCGRLQLDGFSFDLGPTLLLMPEVLEETFRAAGRRVSDYLQLTRCDPNYRIHFRDGSNVTFTSELTRMHQELERIEPGSFQRYLEFLALGRNQYTTSLERFVGRNFDSIFEFFAPSSLKKVWEIKALKTMYPEVSRFFRDDRLRAALTFQTMYLGISPFEAPAVYGLLPFTELGMGIWFPKGGMHAVPRALEAVCREHGVRFHYGTEVTRIRVRGGQAKGVLLADGTEIDGDAVLCNADLPWAYRNLLDAHDTRLPRAEKLRYTSSAFMMYLGVRRRYSELEHHNVVFGRDYRASFEDIFQKFKVPDDPSFYVNAPAHTDPSLAPEGKDALYVLVPVPHRHASIDWSEEGPKVRAKVLSRLAELGMPELERDIEVERTFTPDDWAVELNLERGAAFGLSHNFMQVGPFRPTNQDPKIRNLFFVGASTQPGTGLPMVMLSARLVTERLMKWSDARAVPSRSVPQSSQEVAA